MIGRVPRPEKALMTKTSSTAVEVLKDKNGVHLSAREFFHICSSSSLDVVSLTNFDSSSLLALEVKIRITCTSLSTKIVFTFECLDG